MKNENCTSVKKCIALAVTAVFVLGLLCSCGGAEEETATEASETSKATVTAGEAAEKESQKKKSIFVIIGQLLERKKNCNYNHFFKIKFAFSNCNPTKK